MDKFAQFIKVLVDGINSLHSNVWGFSLIGLALFARNHVDTTESTSLISAGLLLLRAPSSSNGSTEVKPVTTT